VFTMTGYRNRRIFFGAILGLSVCWTAAAAGLDESEDDYALKLLGKYVFFDEKLSEPARQGCVTCHDPRAGGTPAIAGINKHQVAMNGANPHGHGALATPTNTYASLIPDFQVNDLTQTDCRPFGPFRFDGNTYCGGNFWNGRAQGPTLLGDGVMYPQETDHIGDEVFQRDGSVDADLKNRYGEHNNSISDQALNPFVNPVEQGTTREVVCEKVAASRYAPLFEEAWGEPINCSADEAPVPAEHGFERWVDISFKRIAVALGAYQSSSDINSFTSFRDYALRSELACLKDDDNVYGVTLVDVLGPYDEWSKYFDPDEYFVEEICEDVWGQIQEIAASTPDGEDPRKIRPGQFPFLLFTPEQNLGHDLFYNLGFPFLPPDSVPFPELPVTNCTECHLSALDLEDDGTGLLEQYTDYRYHNIGSPANPEIGMPPDPGLSGHLLSPEDAVAGRNPGAHKTPTLRNVGKVLGEGWTRNYGHNGWFKSLESITHYYNTAFLGNCSIAAGDCDEQPRPAPYEETTAYQFGITACEGPTTEAEALRLNCWPEPEWPQTAVPPFLVGDLGMTAEQEAALVAYMRTFDDAHSATAPRPYRNK
jgi:cytochrome c peroxidase